MNVQVQDWQDSTPAPMARAMGATPSPSGRFQTMPSWGNRYFESAETNRLNQAHWLRADDVTVNVWLAAQLPTIRSRATYETRQNGIVQGIQNTYADDVVGPDGPTLQVISDDERYNSALEDLWRGWFSAPTPRPNVSGTTLLKLWVRNLWRCGEFLARIATDDQAESPVKMRLLPMHPRRLVTPANLAGDANTTMGIRFDSLGRPAQYFIADASISGNYLGMVDATPYPPDLVIHEFSIDEEDQARGIPWLNPGLQPSADLRDYDNQVQDAARQIADQSAILYTDHPDAVLWQTPETTDVQRRTIRQAPPGWKPFIYPATMPPVQYPDYRAERLREIGRPVGMPLLMIRLDASRHNYSSARLDTQCYRRAIAGVQSWLSGTERSCGTLNRLVDAVAREGRFVVPALRRRPAKVTYRWTWPAMPHVDPVKEANAEQIALETGTLLFADAVANRSRDLEGHLAGMVREREMLAEAGITSLPWITGGNGNDAPVDESQQVTDALEEAGVTAT
jgi:capsid protein